MTAQQPWGSCRCSPAAQQRWKAIRFTSASHNCFTILFYPSILECLKIFYNPSLKGLHFITSGVATDKPRTEHFEFWLAGTMTFHQTKLCHSSPSDTINPRCCRYTVAVLPTFLYVVLRRPGRISIRIGIAVLHNSSLLVLVVHGGWGWRWGGVIEHWHLVRGRRGGRSRAIGNWKRWESFFTWKPACRYKQTWGCRL